MKYIQWSRENTVAGIGSASITNNDDSDQGPSESSNTGEDNRNVDAQHNLYYLTYFPDLRRSERNTAETPPHRYGFDQFHLTAIHKTEEDIPQTCDKRVIVTMHLGG